MHKEKLWTKDFINITTINFFIFLAFYILIAVLPMYLVDTLHEGTDKVGLMITFFLLPAILIRPFAGKWVSSGSQKKILIYSVSGFFISTMLYPFATNIGVLLILRVLHGITFGVITTVLGTICAEIIPKTRRGEGLSYFSMAMGLAMVFGPYIGLHFVNINAYNTAFIVCMAISAINIILALFMKVPVRIKQLNMKSKKSGFSLNDIFDKKAAPFALSTFIFACAYSGVSAFLSLYAKELGMAEAASSFFIIYAIFVLLSRPFTGKWSDKFGAKVILYPCLILFALGMLMLSMAHSSIMIFMAGALIGIGYGSIIPVLQTQTINSVDPHRVGMANSLSFSSMDAGMAVGSYVLGIVADAYSYGSIYMVGMVLIIVAGIQYFALTKEAPIAEFICDDEDIAV